MTEPTPRKKAETPEHCPKCNVAPEVRRKGAYWLLACPNYTGVISTCKTEGWTMGSKRDAIEQWNIVVRKIRGDSPGAST